MWGGWGKSFGDPCQNKKLKQNPALGAMEVCIVGSRGGVQRGRFHNGLKAPKRYRSCGQLMVKK